MRTFYAMNKCTHKTGRCPVCSNEISVYDDLLESVRMCDISDCISDPPPPQHENGVGWHEFEPWYYFERIGSLRVGARAFVQVDLHALVLSFRRRLSGR